MFLSAFIVTFDTHVGDLQLMSADVTSLTLTGQAAPQMFIEEERKGSYEADECSGLGICDHTLGICNCLSGYTSSDYNGGPGEFGECGYRLIYPVDIGMN